MVPYIVAGLVLLVLLFFAYRLLGGREASTPVDSDSLMHAACEGTIRADRLIAEGDARQARRTLDGSGLQLQQVEVARLSDHAVAAHALLSAAVEELSWAARMMQSPAYGTATGLHDAADQLQLHAHECVAHAQQLLAPSGVSEEVDSPA